MRQHAVKQLTKLLQAAAVTTQVAPAVVVQQLLPGCVFCAASLRCSAAFGDQQVPWNSLLLQAFRTPFCTLPDVTSSGSRSPMADQQQQREAMQTAASAAPRAAKTAPLNFDDFPELRLQQNNDQHVVTLKPAPKSPRYNKQKAFQIPDEVFSAMQQAEPGSSNSSIPDPTSDPTCIRSSVSLLLRHIVERHEQLAAWQTRPQPTYDELVQYDRLKLSSGQQHGSSSSSAVSITDEAYRERSMLIKRFGSKGLFKTLAVDHGLQVPKQLLPLALESFKRFMARAATPGLTAAMLISGALRPTSAQLYAAAVTAAEQQEGTAAAATAAREPAAAVGINYTSAVEQLLLPYFVQFCRQQYKEEVELYAAQVSTLDLRSPHTWYQYARAIKRKIIYHGGPTNSGKTYNALQSLAAADRGVYCAPLRLLAMEVYETLNHMGVYCDLVTGQEILKVPGSGHMSCTVEMAALNTHADVAVIDEIQLIGDEQRGFAWTRALLGLPANTIHVCGDTSAVALVRHLANICGDEFELHTYSRMTPLNLDDKGLPNGWSDIQPGDAVVAFSRKSIYKTRKAIEAATGQRTCIVYGALPAETRRHQARLFNDPHSDANVLIASDAIGLGLNFNIRRVIFTSLLKKGHNGRGTQPVPVSLVKQIAGRAGRRNSIYPEGCVTTFSHKDLPVLKKALELPADKLHTPAAGLAPEYETMELLSAQFPELNLEQLLRKLDSEARLDGKYFLCNQRQMLETAQVLVTVKGLSLADQFTLVNAPLDAYDERQRRAFLEFTNTYAAGHPVVFNEGLMPPGPPADEWQMNEAESLHKVITLWLWLSYRFEEGTFPGREKVQSLARTLSNWLNIGLANIQTAAVKQAAAAVAAHDASSDSSGNNEVDSTDADEVNESVFNTPVIEQEPPPAAAAAAVASGIVCDSFDSKLNSSSSKNPANSQLQGAGIKAARVPITYINWGSAVSLGLAHLSAGDDRASIDESESEDDESETKEHKQAAEMMSETSYAAAYCVYVCLGGQRNFFYGKKLGKLLDCILWHKFRRVEVPSCVPPVDRRMRVCCFGAQSTKHDAVEDDYRDLLVSTTATAADSVAASAEIVMSEAAKAAGTEPESPGAGTMQQQETGPLATEDVFMEPVAAPAVCDSSVAAQEQQVPEQQEYQLCKGAAEPDPSLLLPAIKFFVHNVTDSHRLAIDQLTSIVCQALGEGAIRSVQGEYKSEEPVPPSNTILGHLKGFDFPTFFQHAQQLPAQMLMVLLVLTGQKTNASKQQPVSVSLRKARRIRAAAEKYLSSNSSSIGSPKQQSSPRAQPLMDAERFKKLLLETDPTAYSMMDSSISQYNRESYTGRDAVLTIDTAAEVLATAGAATRDQFSSRFCEGAVDNQSSITFADMKKCLPAIHRLRHQEGSIIRALLRSETNDMSAAKGVPVLRQFAAEYMNNPRYAANTQLPVVLPALAPAPCCATTAVRRVTSDAQRQLEQLQA